MREGNKDYILAFLGPVEVGFFLVFPNATCKLDRLPSLAVFFFVFSCDVAADDKTESLGVSSFPSLHEVFMAKRSPCLYSARISNSAALHVTHPGPVSLHLNDRAFILFD